MTSSQEPLFEKPADREREGQCRERLAAIVEASWDAIFGIDDQGRITDWNAGAERVYGYAGEEAIGQPVALLLPQGQREEESEILHAARTGRRLDHFHTQRRRKDGQLIHVSVGVSPLVDVQGRTIGLTRIERDLTDLRQVEQEMQQARQAADTAKEIAEDAMRVRSQLLASVSHELRTPMNVILGMLQLSMEEPMNATLRDYLATATDSAESLLQLLNDLLDFSHIESSCFTIEHRPFSLRAVVDEALRTFHARALGKGLELSCEIDPTVPDALEGDASRLRQIIVNLVANAIKFTEQGVIVVRIAAGFASRKETRVSFSVRDTGMGIAPEHRRRIFDAFAQLDSSTTRQHAGVGLGLAICSQLLLRMGAHLELDSEQGKGSEFRFVITFPRADESESAQTTFVSLDSQVNSLDCVDARNSVNQTPRVSSLNRQLKVLLVEDTPANQKVVASILKRQGHRVRFARNGREAVERAKNESFDVILMDIQMPIMDGYQATAAIRELQKGQALQTPIIAMTAHAMRGDREKCLEVGMDAYVAKPFNMQELLELLASVCSPDCTPGVARDRDTTVDAAGFSKDASLQDPSRAHQPAAHSKVVDIASAILRLDGDWDLLREFVEVYFQDAPNLMTVIRRAVSEDDPVSLHRGAHSLKGLAANFGAADVVRAARQLELAGATGNAAALIDELATLESAIVQLDEALRQLSK